MSEPETKQGEVPSVEPPPEPPKGEEPVQYNLDAPSSKGEREIKKWEPPQERGGYQRKEHEEKEAEKQQLPKDKRGNPIEKKGVEASSGPVFKFKTESETIYGSTNKQNADDKDYWAGFRSKTSDIEALDFAVNKAEGKAKVTLVKAEGEAQIWHGQVNVGEKLNKFFGLLPKVPEIKTLPSFAPMAARVGDITTHGSLLAPGTGSPNVLIGGLPAWRVGLDFAACTAPGVGAHGAGPTATGALNVFVNGMPLARVGDWVIEPNGGPNVIVKGCETVLIGTAAVAPPAPPDAARPKPDKPMFLFEGIWEMNVGHVEAKGNAYGDADLKKGKASLKAEIDAEAAGLKVKGPIGVKVALPWGEKYVCFGVAPEVSALSIGGGAGAKVENGKAEVGAKIGLGLLGGGVKLNVGIVD